MTEKDVDELPLRQTTKPKGNRNRIGFIDLTRGILFLLMTNSHAITLAEVPKSSFWNSGWWLPRGWATTSFIILSGFAIGYIFDWRNDAKITNLRLLRRSKEILLVMFFSNILMRFFSLLFQGQLAIMATVKWWIGLITFHTPYSISAILIPTGLLLAIAPVLLGFEKKCPFSLLIISFGCVIWATFHKMELEVQNSIHHLSNILFLDGEGHFPIFLFLTYGMTGLALGTLCQRNKKFGVIIIIIFVFLFLSITFLNPPDDNGILELTKFSIISTARFCLLLCIGFLLDHYNIIFISKNLNMIGIFALFTFVIHRVILQMYHLLIVILYPSLNCIMMYFIFIIFSMLSIGVLCYFRGFKAFNAALKRLYL